MFRPRLRFVLRLQLLTDTFFNTLILERRTRETLKNLEIPAELNFLLMTSGVLNKDFEEAQCALK
jgi:hypothetical protein